LKGWFVLETADMWTAAATRQCRARLARVVDRAAGMRRRGPLSRRSRATGPRLRPKQTRFPVDEAAAVWHLHSGRRADCPARKSRLSFWVLEGARMLFLKRTLFLIFFALLLCPVTPRAQSLGFADPESVGFSRE